MTWRHCMRILLKLHFFQTRYLCSLMPGKTNKTIGTLLWTVWVHGSLPVSDMSGKHKYFVARLRVFQGQRIHN